MRGTLRFVLSIVILAAVFGCVNLHASLTSTSYDRSDLTREYRLEKIRHDRLKVELIRLSSPQYVMAGAEKAGMVPAGRYDYLDRTDTLASAGRQAE